MRTTTRLGAVAATAAGTLLLTGLGAVAPAQAAAGLTTDAVRYAPAIAESPSPYVPLSCGVEVDFTDPTRGYDYDVLVSPEVDVDVYLEESRTGGSFYLDCGDPETGFQHGTTYTFTVVELNDRGRISETAAARQLTFTEVGAPAHAVLESAGRPVQGTDLPTGPVSIRFEGEFEPGTSFLTLVRSSPTTDFGAADQRRAPVLSSYVASASAPTSQFTVPHTLGGQQIWISVRAQKAGRAPVVFGWQPLRAVTPPATELVPAGFISKGGGFVASAQTGIDSSVGAIVLSPAGVQGGARVYYQWFLDGVKVPGATSRTYRPPLAAAGKTLTLGYAVAAPGYVARSATLTFGKVTLSEVRRSAVRTPPKPGGTAQVGRTVGVSAPVLAESGLRVTYQWFADGKKIPGATARTYKVAAGARGKTLTVTVAVTRPDFKPLTYSLNLGRAR